MRPSLNLSCDFVVGSGFYCVLPLFWDELRTLVVCMFKRFWSFMTSEFGSKADPFLARWAVGLFWSTLVGVVCWEKETFSRTVDISFSFSWLNVRKKMLWSTSALFWPHALTSESGMATQKLLLEERDSSKSSSSQLCGFTPLRHFFDGDGFFVVVPVAPFRLF